MHVLKFIGKLTKMAFYLACCGVIAGMAPAVAQVYMGQLGAPISPAAMKKEVSDPLLLDGSQSAFPPMLQAATSAFADRCGAPSDPPRLDVFVTSIVRNASAKRTMLLWLSYPASVRGRAFGGGGVESPAATGGW